MIKNKKTEWDSLIKQSNTLIRSCVNQRKDRKRNDRKRKDSSIPQPTSCSRWRPMSHTMFSWETQITDGTFLIKTIPDLALVGSSADSHWSNEVINNCKSLDDLAEKLKCLGFNLSRSSLYLCLLARENDSLEEKRHKKVVNVKLYRAIPNDIKLQIIHIDSFLPLQCIMSRISQFLWAKKMLLFKSEDDKI